MQQPHPREIALGRRNPGAMESRHQRAGPHAEMASQAAYGAERRRQPRHRFEEQPRFFRRFAERGDESREDAGCNRRGRMPHEISQPSPAIGLSAVDGTANTGRAQAQ